MAGLWQQWCDWLGVRRKRTAIQQRFEKFIAACAANDEFLSGLARMMERADSPAQLSMSEVHGYYEALSDAAATMVASMVAMSGERYSALPSRLESMCRQIEISVLKERPIEALPLVVWPDAPEAENVEVVGGKTANLVTIARRTSVSLPPFFAVTTRGYHQFMEATGLAVRVGELLDSHRLADARSVRRASAELVGEILSATVPADLAKEIHRAFVKLRAMQQDDFGVAVRSSAVVEDTERSFAGQFETVLGVREDGLMDAYRRVVASKYRPEAIEYARLCGYIDEEVAMPVLVMAMVQPHASGVAYSCDPDKRERAVVTAVRGLAEASVDGRVVPDRYHVSRSTPHKILKTVLASNRTMLRCSSVGGTVEERISEDAVAPAIESAQAIEICRLALRIEELLGHPQDMEWVIDSAGKLHVVQCRPLRCNEPDPDGEIPAEEPLGHRILAAGATSTSPGVAIGRIARINSVEESEGVPDGAVLVVPTTSPRLAAVVGRVAAIVTQTGSPTGHMATVAREFRVPLLVGVDIDTCGFVEGMTVTVDGRSGTIYEGEVKALLAASRERSRSERNPVMQCLTRLVQAVSPLTLPAPDSPDFKMENCTTLHDIARFVHQSVMAEMFCIDELPTAERRAAKRLRWRVPMEVQILDLGGGVAQEADAEIAPQDVRSVPLLALIEGMTDPRQRWAGPVGFDLKGFMSVVVRSAADDQRYGEPSFALCSNEFVHFSSRLAYHFATVDAMCSSSPNRNYARFVFFGGAAVAERREWRAHFLGTVLLHNGFEVVRNGDRVEAFLGKRPSAAIEENLVMVGRLMVAARHLDMLMENRATAEAYANAFLTGDFGFEFVRRGIT
ncbi:MAG: hypothetical protein HY898_14030 [Deltaproteobacteria bacterium]|nr:hypothetical protein [Deltaproteobacteria bacterium]